MEYKGECVHYQASGSLSLLAKYSKHESAFLITGHLLMKFKETRTAAGFSGHCDKATVCKIHVQVKT